MITSIQKKNIKQRITIIQQCLASDSHPHHSVTRLTGLTASDNVVTFHFSTFLSKPS